MDPRSPLRRPPWTARLRASTLGLLPALLLGTSGTVPPAAASPQDAPSGPLRAVPFESVRIHDEHFAPRLATSRRVTLPACLDRCEETGRIENFAVAGGLAAGEHQGQLYNDSDVYKVLEGVAYTLALAEDPELERRADLVIDAIAAAQEEDGYLNTYVQLVKPKERWTDIAHGHELYCAGHLIEAGIAYERATGKRKLLDVGIRFAELVDAEFGPRKRLDPPGHQEIELALVKLARATGDARWARLARFFLEQRGSEERRTPWGEYWQDHEPVWRQREAVGHAVRALYMYCAMTDVAAATEDAGQLGTLLTLWQDVFRRKMYVTGGVGSSAGNEGFREPWVLPNDEAYCETCAAFGMVLWNHRLFLATRHAVFAEVMERALYNNLMAGVAESGDRFFYDNPLASRGDHHRVPWFDCSCCPTNLARALPSLGERLYAQDGKNVYVLLYVQSEARIRLDGGAVTLRQETAFPRDGAVRIAVQAETPVEFTLHLRIPGWCETEFEHGVNDHISKSTVTHGDDPGTFFRYERVWKDGDVVTLDLPLVPHRVRADERVEAARGRVAIQRGPVVYALEGVDHGGRARNLVLPPGAELTAVFRPELLSGTTVVRAKGIAVEEEGGARVERAALLQAVPYFLWDERDPGEMVVWIPETADLAELPGEARARQAGATLSASHCWRTDTVLALNDGRHPSSSDDHSIPRHTFWDHRGTDEWVACELDAPRRVDEVSVYWFDDTGRGACRTPRSWRLSWFDGTTWRPVELVAGEAFGTRRDAFNRVRFEAVEARGLRLDVRLRADYSAGVLEWAVGPLE